jgi:hypothetical protein
MIELSAFKEFLNGLGWFLTLGKSDTEQIRRELTDLLQHTSQSLRSLLELSDALEDIPLERFNGEAFWPIQRHCLCFFTSPEGARQARSHCTDIERDVARINFKMAKILRTEVGNWKGVNEAFSTLANADQNFLEKYEDELQRIGKELDDIAGLLRDNKNRDGWEKYQSLRSSLMQDRAALRTEFARMDEAENHIRRLLT